MTVPTLVRVRPEKVATPALASTVVVPARVLFPGDAGDGHGHAPVEVRVRDAGLVEDRDGQAESLIDLDRAGGWVVISSLAGGIGVTLIGVEAGEVRPSPVATSV